MSECQERSEGRIGNTAELLDAAVGHFGSIPEGRARGHAMNVHRPYSMSRPG